MPLKQKLEIRSEKIVNRSFVKDPGEKLALQRLRVLELSKQLGSVTDACRQSGMARNSFYEWKRRYQTHGLEGLKDLPPVHKTHPFTTPEHVKQAVLVLSGDNPSWGSKRLSSELLKQGMKLSNFSVQAILKKAGLGTQFDRFLKKEEDLLKGVELPVETIRKLEKLNPALKERHVESSAPGELVSFDTFYVGIFKGIGRVYLHTAVDTYGSYAFGMLATERNSVRATELLYGQVLPFYEAHDLKLKAVLTDNGSEFVGNDTHPFEALLYSLEIQHRRTRVRRPQTNGFVERFHRTILNEFFRIELRKRHFATLDDLEAALQMWLCQYNTDRPHQGYRNKGKTPYEVVEGALTVTQEA
jgi:transposase InsO family protein/transposase